MAIEPTIKIDQATLGAGVAGASRADGVVSQVVTLTDPANPGAQAGRLWEVFDTDGVVVVLSDNTAEAPTYTPGAGDHGTHTIFVSYGDGTKSWIKGANGERIQLNQGGFAIAQAVLGNVIPGGGETTQFGPAGFTAKLNSILRPVDGQLPTSDEKAALVGTSGAPTTGNKFVTDADSRNSDARVPTAHSHTHASTTGKTANDHHAQAHGLGGADHNSATLAQLNAKVSDATLIDTADSRLSDDRDPNAHDLAGADHNAATLAQLNLKVSDATLIDTTDSRLSDARVPTAHTHTHASTTGQTADDHHAQVHDLAGADHNSATLAQLNLKISDATLIDTADSRLSDARAPTAHTHTHASTTGQTADDHHAQAHDLGGADHNTATLAQLNLKVSDATLIDTGDSRLSDARDADAIITTAGPTTLAVGAIADGQFLVRSGATVVGAAAAATSLNAAYGVGRTITIDSGAVILDADVVDTSSALEITREPASSVVARGILVSMGINADGNGIEIQDLGEASGLHINKDGGGSAIDINQGGSGDAINITLDGDIGAQALVITETSKARTSVLCHIIGDSTSSGTLMEIRKDDGTGILLFLNNDETVSSGHPLRIDNASTSTSADCIEINHTGKGKGIDLNISGTPAQRGIELTYNGSSNALYIQASGTGTGFYITNSGSGIGLQIANSTVSAALYVDQNGTGDVAQFYGAGGSVTQINSDCSFRQDTNGNPASAFIINNPDASMASTDTMLTIACNTSEATAYSWLECLSSGSDKEFRIQSNGGCFQDTGGYNTGGADYAEMLDTASARASYDEGDVVVISANETIDKSTTANSTAIVGVYSTNPSVLGNNPMSGLLMMDQGTLEVSPWAWAADPQAPKTWVKLEIDGDQTANYAVGTDLRMDAPYSNVGMEVVSVSHNPGLDKTTVYVDTPWPNLPTQTELYYGVPERESIPVGMLGKVPTKCITENGTISPGDLLVTSSTAGHAMKAGATPAAGTVLGRAYETLTDTGAGTDTGLLDCIISI